MLIEDVDIEDGYQSPADGARPSAAPAAPAYAPHQTYNPAPARSMPPPEDMYDTEIAALQAQLNSVSGIKAQAISREITQLQQIEAKKATVAATPQPAAVSEAPAGTPQAVAYALATGQPYKTQDGQLMELVSVAFRPNPSDLYFAGVDVWFTGYHGSPTPQLMASGTTSPVSFLAEVTGETVTFAVQSFGSSGLSSALGAAPVGSLALDGAEGAPPQPTVTQQLAPTPTGYQFEFSQEAGLEADVVDGYNVYRAASNSFAAASKVDHVAQDPTNTGVVVWQDVQPAGVTMYYWLTAVNTSGDESAPTACQSTAVMSGSGLNSAGQLVTGTPSTPVSNLDSGTARANTAIDAGNVVVAAAIDLSRGYINKTLDNVPPGNTYTSLPIAATTGTGTGTKVQLTDAAGVSGELPHVNSSSETRSVITGTARVSSTAKLDGEYSIKGVGDDQTLSVENETTGVLQQNRHDPTVLLGSVTGLQRNLVPDSDLKYTAAYWTLRANVAIGRSGAGGCNYAIYTAPGGTGPQGEQFVQSSPWQQVVGETYTLSAGVNAEMAGNTVGICIQNGDGSAYKIFTLAAGSPAQRYSWSWTVASGDPLTVYFMVYDYSGSVWPAGKYVTVTAPQVEGGAAMTAYRPNALDDLTGYIPHAAMSDAVRAAIEALDGSGHASLSTATKLLIALTDLEAASLIADNLAETTTRKWAGESGADITGSHTSANTSAIGTVSAVTIQQRIGITFSCAGRMPYISGTTLTIPSIIICFRANGDWCRLQPQTLTVSQWQAVYFAWVSKGNATVAAITFNAGNYASTLQSASNELVGMVNDDGAALYFSAAWLNANHFSAMQTVIDELAQIAASTTLNAQGSIGGAVCDCTLSLIYFFAESSDNERSLPVPLGELMYTGTAMFHCTTAGTCAATAPTWNNVVGATTTDGTAVWTCEALTDRSDGIQVTISAGTATTRDGTTITVPAQSFRRVTWNGSNLEYSVNGGTQHIYYGSLVLTPAGVPVLQELPDNSPTSLAKCYADGNIPVWKGASIHMPYGWDDGPQTSTSGDYVGL